MLSIVFYLIYFVLCLSSIYFTNQHRIYILIPLIFTAQFNVTSFLKIGVTISFFELNLIIVVLSILITQTVKGLGINNMIRFKKQDRVWGIFLLICLLYIPISMLRVNLGNLHPDPDFKPVYYVRGLMSLNKFFFYFPCFYIIRSYLMQFYSELDLKLEFIKAMAWSGLLPVLAVFVQYFALGSVLLHNNPSFAEIYRLQLYAGARPVGLTNEASFFVFQLFFSSMALYYGWKNGLFSRNVFYVISALYLVGVVLSISRTGLVFFAFFYLIVWLREIRIFTISGFLKSLKFLPIIALVVGLVLSLNIGGFNLGDRVFSAFKSEADASTIERYGSANALLHLFLDKCLFLGVGIYNHQYYIKSYLPPEMSMFYYPKGTSPASFNFVFQLMVEFGLIVFLIFCFIERKLIFQNNTDRFYKDWFLFLLLYSFLFQTLNFAVPFLIFFYPAGKLMSEGSLSKIEIR